MPVNGQNRIPSIQAGPKAAFRYTDDPALEVVSFGVDPERAVGGQVQIGHRVNVYKAKKTDGASAYRESTKTNAELQTDIGAITVISTSTSVTSLDQGDRISIKFTAEAPVLLPIR